MDQFNQFSTLTIFKLFDEETFFPSSGRERIRRDLPSNPLDKELLLFDVKLFFDD